MFESLGKLLPHALRTPSARKSVEAAMVIASTEEALRDVFGAETTARLRVVSFKNGVITIVCERSVYAQEIALREREVVACANRRLGADMVKKLRPTG